MKRGAQALLLGLAMLVGSLLLDFVGSRMQSLLILVLSLAIGVGGAIVALRGLVEFLGDLF